MQSSWSLAGAVNFLTSAEGVMSLLVVAHCDFGTFKVCYCDV